MSLNSRTSDAQHDSAVFAHSKLIFSFSFQISEYHTGKRRLKSKMEIDPATQVNKKYTKTCVKFFVRVLCISLQKFVRPGQNLMSVLKCFKPKIKTFETMFWYQTQSDFKCTAIISSSFSRATPACTSATPTTSGPSTWGASGRTLSSTLNRFKCIITRAQRLNEYILMLNGCCTPT